MLVRYQLVITVWSNYRPADRMWPAAEFSVSRGCLQEKSSNLKFTFISLNCLHWIKCICTRTMNSLLPFLCATVVFVLFIHFKIKLEGTVFPNPPLGHLYRSPLCFFGAPAFVVVNSTSGTMNSVPPNKSVYLSSKRGLFKVAPYPN